MGRHNTAPCDLMNNKIIDIDSYPRLTQGDYVVSPVKNEFNPAISYWVSKKGYATAFYMFSVMTRKEAQMMLDTDGFMESAINRFDAAISSQTSKTDRWVIHQIETGLYYDAEAKDFVELDGATVFYDIRDAESIQELLDEEYEYCHTIVAYRGGRK